LFASQLLLQNGDETPFLCIGLETCAPLGNAESFIVSQDAREYLGCIRPISSATYNRNLLSAVDLCASGEI
jgi:hypothetical protein